MKKQMRAARAVARALCASALLTLLMAGCGSSVSGNVERTGTVSPSDPEAIAGNHGDLVEYHVSQAGYYTVTMAGTGSDPVSDPEVMVFRSDGSDWVRIAGDDDSGPGPAAQCTFYATVGDYRIQLSTHYANDFGDYTYSIYRDDSRAAAVAETDPVKEPSDAASRQIH